MNGFLIVNKPSDWTSHDVVAKLRGIYKERRIGHAGTLDPMATGVLTVFLGRATRAAALLENDEKEYVAGLKLGLVTNTQDVTGEVLETHPADVSRAGLEQALQGFLGPQAQIPPMYSAVKIGGKKLYELARKGQTVERAPRAITIRALELLNWNGQEGCFRVVCSKGTYVRTLCHDIGQALGTGGCLSSLERTRAGRFSIEEAVTLEEIRQAQETGGHLALVRPVDQLFSDCPAVILTEAQTGKLKNGAENLRPDLKDGRYRVYGPGAEFLALGECRAGRLGTVKSFFEPCEKQ